MSLTVKDPETLIPCPYNVAHQIISSRMQTHLVKCKRNYPDAKRVECIYNSIHKVPEPELKYHHETCKDREKLDKFCYIPENVNMDRFPIVNVEVKSEENWDYGCYPTYNPEIACMSKPVLRQLNVQSAAKRRNFRMEERQRVQQLQEALRKEKNNVDSRMEVPRRPVQMTSAVTLPAKVVDEDDPYSISTLMEKVKLGSNKVVVPAKPPQNGGQLFHGFS